MALNPKAYFQLMRFHKPIGTLLLFFPVYWAWKLAYASPPVDMLIVFTLGVILARAAGCIVNDICDRNIDTRVARTQQRPLAANTISLRDAYITLALLSACLLSLLLFLNNHTQILAISAAALTVFYPLTKRFFAFPQLILGITFNMGVLMMFAQAGNFSPTAWILYAASVLWTFSYDTIYAMADQQDDLCVGIHSSALTLGRYVHEAVCCGYSLTFLLLGFVFGKVMVGIIIALLCWPIYFLILKNKINQAPLAYFQYNAVLGVVLSFVY